MKDESPLSLLLNQKKTKKRTVGPMQLKWNFPSIFPTDSGRGQDGDLWPFVNGVTHFPSHSGLLDVIVSMACLLSSFPNALSTHYFLFFFVFQLSSPTKLRYLQPVTPPRPPPLANSLEALSNQHLFCNPYVLTCIFIKLS